MTYADGFAAGIGAGVLATSVIIGLTLFLAEKFFGGR